MQMLFRLSVLILLALCGRVPMAGAGQSIVVMQTGLPYEEETWFSSGLRNDLQEEQVKANYEVGKVITSVGYGASGWLVAMAKSGEAKGQIYCYRHDWPEEWIKEMHRDGYAITGAVNGWGKWLVVMSKGTGLTSQVWANGTLAELNPQISEWWGQGYFITSASGLSDGKWMIVASKGGPVSSQAWASRHDWEEIESWIKGETGTGYNLQLLEPGQEGYLAVVSKYIDGRSCTQEFQRFDSSPKEYIQDGWNKGMGVLYVGGGSQPAEKKGRGRLPGEGETIYMGIKGGGSDYASVKCFRDGNGELRYDIYPSPTPEKGFYTYKHEDTKGGNFMLSRYHMTLKGKAIFGNQKWEARPDGYVVLISETDGSMVFPDGKIYDIPTTYDKIKGGGSKNTQPSQSAFQTDNNLGNSSEAVLKEVGASVSSVLSTSSATCGICGGDGICTGCKGQKGSWKAAEGSGEKIWVECPSCKGTGSCFSCHGTGKE